MNHIIKLGACDFCTSESILNKRLKKDIRKAEYLINTEYSKLKLCVPHIKQLYNELQHYVYKEEQ